MGDNSTALVPFAGPTAALTPFVPSNIEQALALAERLADANLLPASLRKRPADVLLLTMYAKDLGLTFSEALRGLHLIEGRAVLSADLMVALARRSGQCERFDLLETSDTRATYETHRRGAPSPIRMTWTIQMAQTAGLAKRDTWVKYPGAMLRARCASALVRAVYPDCLFGVYDPDELASGAGAPVATVVAAEADDEPPADPPPHITEIAGRAPEPPEGSVRVAHRSFEELAATIEGATAEELEALIPELRELPAGDAARLRPLYNARSKYLAAEAAKAAEQGA